MKKHRKKYAEFRFYEKPVKEPALALTGERWIGQYGEGIDYLHFHNLAEVGICIQGSGELVFNNKIFPYKSGTFTFVPQNYLHHTRSTEICYWEYLFFDMEELLASFYQDTPESGKKLLRILCSQAHACSMEEECMGQVIHMIFEQMRRKESYYKETVKGLLYTLLMQVAGKNEGVTPMELQEGDRSKIFPSLDYIRCHYKENIRVSELADSCHLSETHFRRIFREDMGMGPVEYLNLIRIQEACDLMRKGDSNMEEVAVKAGYQTISTFNRNFRQIIGTSPYQWKKKADLEWEKMEHYHISAKRGW